MKLQQAKLVPRRLAARREWLERIKYWIVGQEANRGLIFRIALYVILLSTAYIYINPILYMLVTMVKSEKDLLDPTVQWVPSHLYGGHLNAAYTSLKYGTSFAISMGVAVVSAIFHCLSCAVAGFAFARLQFPFKRLLFFMLLVALIVPPQVTILPMIIAYNQLGFHNSVIALVVPSLFGFGVKGPLFVLIYRQFFASQPKELEEAARMEGAGAWKIFIRVMLPVAKPAALVVLLFSFVWTWNDSYLPNMFMTTAQNVPLASQMSRLDQVIETMLTTGQAPLYYFEPIKMAASFLSILPPLLLYFLAQRWFTESVERTGLVE